MHDDLEHFHKAQPKTFTKIPPILKTPKKISKTHNLGLMHEMHEE